MNDSCLRCGKPLPSTCRLICLTCFGRLPVGLRLQWRRARGELAKQACVKRVRSFVTSLNAHDAKGLESDFAVGQNRLGETATDCRLGPDVGGKVGA